MGNSDAPRPVVMVVDNDEAVHAALRLVLEDEYYEVISAFGGAEGLRELQHRRVDLVLLDLIMPGVDGWEVFERLLQMDGRRPKVIFLTGIDSSAAAVTAIKLGAQDWIVKPFDDSALLMQLHALLPTTRRIRLQGGSLGTRRTIAVVATVRCGVPVEYQAPNSGPADPRGALVLDAAGAGTETG